LLRAARRLNSGDNMRSVARIAGFFAVPVAVIVGGCSESSSPAAPDDAGAADGAGGSSETGAAGGSLVEQRPFKLKVPSGYDASKPTPLLILLHGYSASGFLQDAYFNLAPVADDKTFLYAYADGTLDKEKKLYWNATDACCNFDKAPVDDVAYIGAIIDDVSAHYNVDAKRVFIVGHSNGGFMAHRLACDIAPRIAAIVSLAGGQWKDPSLCKPSEPVSVLQVHGDKDETIHYEGGQTQSAVYPSAHETVATWAAKNGCTGALTPDGTTLDLDTNVPGNEAHVERYEGCPASGAVELWTLQGSSHIPSFGPAWGPSIYAFLSAHPKP
jgi:polyhydroxybutyrate depolymerase